MNSNKPTGLPAAVDKHKGVHKAKEKISLKFKFFQIKKTKYAKKNSSLVLDSQSDPITMIVLHVNPHCVILSYYVITEITSRLQSCVSHVGHQDYNNLDMLIVKLQPKSSAKD